MDRPFARSAIVVSMCAVFVASCDSNPDPTGVEVVTPSGSHIEDHHAVNDLRVSAVTDTSMTLTWTQVALSNGEPARYRVKTGPYFDLSADWPDQRTVCNRTIIGTEPGAPLSCTVYGFEPGSGATFRLGSFGVEDGAWVEFAYSNHAGGRTHRHQVLDLAVIDARETSLVVRWTQVDDGSGTGTPASYRVKYGSPLDDWSRGTIGCARTIRGTEIGAVMTCTIEGTEPDILYEVQLASFRVVNGVWTNTRLSNVGGGRYFTEEEGAVDDLEVPSNTANTLTVTWTQVDDGTGNPARYRVKYGNPIWDWSDAEVGCNVRGTAIGQPISCTITAPLVPDDIYEVRLMSYRVVNGVWRDAKFSNLAGRIAVD